MSLRAIATAIAAVVTVTSEAQAGNAQREGAPDRTPSAHLDWLLGRWKGASVGRRWMEMTWTAAPVGLRGVLERMENDGTRTTVAIYLLELAGDGLRLIWQRQPDDKGPPTMTDREVDRLLKPGRRRRRPPAPPRNQVGRRDVFKGSFGVGQSFVVGLDSVASDRGKRSTDDPVLVQITVSNGKLLLEERRATGRFIGGWSSLELARVPDGASRPAP